MKNFITNICDEYATYHNFSGVCMLQANGKTIFAKAYGYANRAFKILNKIDTKFYTSCHIAACGTRQTQTYGLHYCNH